VFQWTKHQVGGTSIKEGGCVTVSPNTKLKMLKSTKLVSASRRRSPSTSLQWLNCDVMRVTCACWLACGWSDIPSLSG